MQALKNVMKKTADDFIYAGDEKETGLAPVYSIETLANAAINSLSGHEKETGLAPVYSIEILESTAITGKACKACFCKLTGGI